MPLTPPALLWVTAAPVQLGGNGAPHGESQVRCGSGEAGRGSRPAPWLTLWPQNHLSTFTLTGTMASPSASQVGAEVDFSRSSALVESFPPYPLQESHMNTRVFHTCSTEHWKLGQDP